MNLIYRSNKLYVVKTLPEEPRPSDYKYPDHYKYFTDLENYDLQSALSNPENLIEVGNQDDVKERIMIHHNMPVLVDGVIYSLPDKEFEYLELESLKVAIISEVTPKEESLSIEIKTGQTLNVEGTLFVFGRDKNTNKIEAFKLGKINP